MRESEEKYRQQYAEASHREKILVRRLASKEQELQEYVVSNFQHILRVLLFIINKTNIKIIVNCM